MNIHPSDFLPFTISPLEILVRGTLMFWFLFLIFRFVLRRDVGSAGISDILFVVLLGDAAQNAMIGEGTGWADGAMLIATLVAWNYLLNMLGYYFSVFEKLTDAPPLLLIRNGRALRRNWRKEHLTDLEIEGKLRSEGIEAMSDVRKMYLEPDGSFSVLRRKR